MNNILTKEIDKIRNEIESKLTDKDRQIIDLIEKHSVMQLYKEVDLAIDKNDMNRLNLVLDAIKTWHGSRKLLQTLPPKLRNELYKQLKNEPSKIQNPRNKSNTDRNKEEPPG